jgi:hypothetical protein
MALCGANFSTVACPQQCLDPITAFQFQNLPTCLNEVRDGQLNIERNDTTWNPVMELFNNCVIQYCSYADQDVGGCPYEVTYRKGGYGELTDRTRVMGFARMLMVVSIQTLEEQV